MQVVRGIVIGLLGLFLMLTVTASQLALANDARPETTDPTYMALSEASNSEQVGDVIWGRVPYCSCLATSATANVASALKDANLTVSLRELSPLDGLLYFTATFDPQSATREQVSEIMHAAGAEIVDGPP